MKKFIKDFKEFAIKGNVVDLAIAVVIGGAFGKIVSSFVSDIIMPLIGYLFGGISFKNIVWILKEAIMEGEEIIEPAIAVNVGNFIQNIFDFLVIALSIFLVIKFILRLKERMLKEKKEEKVEEPTLSKDQELLIEIRDILRKNNN